MNKFFFRLACTLVIVSALLSPTQVYAGWSVSSVISSIFAGVKKHYLLTGLAAVVGTGWLMTYLYKMPKKKDKPFEPSAKTPEIKKTEIKSKTVVVPVDQNKKDLEEFIAGAPKTAPDVGLGEKREIPTLYSDKAYVEYIRYWLKFYNKDLKKKQDFVSQLWANPRNIWTFVTGFPIDSMNRSSIKFFVYLISGSRFNAVNLLLSTGLVDFTGEHGAFIDVRTNKFSEPHSFLGHVVGACGFNLLGHGYHKSNYLAIMVKVLESHGATPYENRAEIVKDSNEKSAKKISIQPLECKPKEKLYFSEDGSLAITEAEFIKQLKNLQ